MGLHAQMAQPGEEDTLRGLLREFAPADKTISPTRNAVIEALRKNPEIRKGFPEEQIRNLVDTYINADQIEWDYRPPEKGFRGDVAIFTPRLDVGDVEFISNSWHPYVSGRVENTIIDCVNDDLLTADFAHQIGTAVSKMLSRQPADDENIEEKA